MGKGLQSLPTHCLSNDANSRAAAVALDRENSATLWDLLRQFLAVQQLRLPEGGKDGGTHRLQRGRESYDMKQGGGGGGGDSHRLCS